MKRGTLLLTVALLLASGPAAGQAAPEVSLPGGPEDERARILQLLGALDTRLSLLRSGSFRLSLVEETRAVRLLDSELRAVWNGGIPVSHNEGLLWAGRGANVRLRAGAVARLGRWTLVVAPEMAWSENRPFQVFPSTDPERSAFASPWHGGPNSLDLPLRFGHEPLAVFGPGQSALSVRLGGVAVGASTENLWWGPGARNGIVLSSNAPGFPHAFLRTADPLETRLGEIDLHWILGGLTESLFFTADGNGSPRSISGFALEFRPAVESDLAVGLARTAVAAERRSRFHRRALDVFLRWNEPYRDEEGHGPAVDPLLSVFARWVSPAAGLEAYGEWSHLSPPRSFRDLLLTPHHTQGYTLGLQWVRAAGERTFRAHGEFTYLEQTRVRADRPPPPPYYTGRASLQGYTNRGQILGASIGPGASSQWIAVDLLGGAIEGPGWGWSAGLRGERIRWENDVLNRIPTRNFFRHDVSFRGGFRAGVRTPWIVVDGEALREARLNYLFQNGVANPGEFRTVDVHHWSFSLTARPGWEWRW